MAQKCGFFNAKKTESGYDRTYNARDYSDNLAAIISNGVRRSEDNDLRVTAIGGLKLNIAYGRAWINGCWYINDTDFTEFSVPTAPVGDNSRIDRVILRLDENIDGREIKLVYLEGVPSASPTAPELTRSGGIYDICLAEINVPPAVGIIEQENIKDTRPDKTLCGWITSPVGYEDYFTNFDAEFNEWFVGVKDTLASVTLFKEYIWRTTLNNVTTTLSFDIPQYDPTGVDIINIYVNGIRAIKNVDYTLNLKNITFTNEKIAGTDIEVVVYKSIDGTGLKSVADEVTELQNQMSKIKNIGEYIYICNGFDDNVKLSDIAQEFLNDDTSYDQMIITIYGKFGANAPYAGAGSSSSRYRWFSIGGAGTTNKKIVFDFEGCSQVTLNCSPNMHYIGFYGLGITLKNANIVANCKFTVGSFVMFSSTLGNIIAENCRFRIDAYSGSYIAQTGTFTNCKGTVTNARGDSYCFNVNTNGLLRVNGGEYYAYTGQNTYNAAVVYVDQAQPDAVVITNEMNCPTVAVSSNYQKNAVLAKAGYGAFNDTITNLAIEKSASQNVRGSIPLSKPDRM